MQKSAVQERPWSEHEKLALLAEILKVSAVPANALLKLIRDYDIHPPWDDIPLPEGRSLNSSRFAFDEINRQAGYHLVQSSNAFSHQAPESWNPPPMLARKRPLPGTEALMPSFPAIQPKPPTLSAAPFAPALTESGTSLRPSPGDLAGEPVRKRRGRPSNAQIEHEKAAAAAEGREWQPRPSRAPRKKRSKTMGDPTLERSRSESTHHSFPPTPEVHTGRPDEDMAGGMTRYDKMQEESPVVRTTPYDPVRQSPSALPSAPAAESPSLPPEPRSLPLGQGSLATTSQMQPDYDPSVHHPPINSDRGHEMTLD